MDFFKELESLIAQASAKPSGGTAASTLADTGSPSTSIAILDNGNISSHCISTVEDNADTAFQACSISKPLTGVLVMKLVERGLVNIDDTICSKLPADIVGFLTADTRTRDAIQSITISQLMSHTSGLSITGFRGYSNCDAAPNIRQIIRGDTRANTKPVQLISLPGLRFIYSGGGFILLQCIVEHITGANFEDVVREVLFEPLGMKRSFFAIPREECNLASAYYTGYKPCDTKCNFLPEYAAGGLWTTPSDLLRLIKAIQSSLDPSASKPFLDSGLTRIMLTNVLETMALTWFSGPSSFSHAGSNEPGWRSFAFGYANLEWNSKPETPEHGLSNAVNIPEMCGISVMTNSAIGDLLYWKVINATAFLKGWPPIDRGHWDSITVPFPAPKGTVIHPSWIDWAGISWEDNWMLSKDNHGNPRASFKGSSFTFALRPGAIPATTYKPGVKSIDLVLDGLQLMLRLGWSASDRTIEVFNEGTGDVHVLRALNH